MSPPPDQAATTRAPVRGSAALLALGSVGAALALGLAAHIATRRWGVFELAGPLLIGAAVGAVSQALIRLLGVPRPRTAGAIAAVAVVGALAFQLALDYRAERARRVAEYAVDDNAVRFGMDPDVLADLRREVRITYTLRQFTAERYSDHSALAAGMLQLALALAIGVGMAWTQAAEPSCPTCGRWRTPELVGDAAMGAADDIAASLEAGDAEAAAAEIEPPDTPELVRLTLLSCPAGHDQGGGVLHIREHLRDRRQVWRWRQVADIAVTPAQMATLRDAEFAPVSEIRTPSDEDGHDGDSDGDDHTAAHTAATDDDSAVADDGAAADERDASHTKDDHQGGASG